jgi:asparagine synthetase B (glutamine-hydrolysing)
MDGFAWDRVIGRDDGTIARLEGHFALVSWGSDYIEFRTDQLGFRNLYLAKCGGSYVFSTRVDWVAQMSGRREIDWTEVGQQCFLLNQLSPGSFLKDTIRLVQGGYARSSLSSARLNVLASPWSPDDGPAAPDAQGLIDSLQAFTLCGLQAGKLSLALSGGFDSRVLLALLLAQPKSEWGIHLYGDPEHPDRTVAARIARDLGVNVRVLEAPIPAAYDLLDMMPEYAGQACLCGPASSAARLSFYSALHDLNIVAIDGAVGELARRRFMTSVLLRGRSAILHGR